MKFSPITVALLAEVAAVSAANSTIQYTASSDVGSTSTDAFPPIGSKFVSYNECSILIL